MHDSTIRELFLKYYLCISANIESKATILAHLSHHYFIAKFLYFFENGSKNAFSTEYHG